jgi:hypothetical protein
MNHRLKYILLIVLALVVLIGAGLYLSWSAKNQRALQAVKDATAHGASDPASVPSLTQQSLPITGTKIHVKFFSDGIYIGPSVIPADKAPSLLSPSTSLDFGTQLASAATKPITKCESPGKTSTTAFVATVFGKPAPVCAIHNKDTGSVLYLISQSRGPDGNIYVSLVLGSTARDLKPFYDTLKPVFDSISMDY